VSDIASSLTQTRTAVVLADDERRRVDADLGARRLLGVRPSELVARPSRDDREQMGIAWAELLERGTFAGRSRLWAPDRRETRIEFTA
jgi:PAS domain-containing protein